MFRLVKLCIGTLVRLFRSQQGLLLENLALRQQLTVLKRRDPRPGLGNFDRLFWVVARRLWSGWKQSLVLVTPETVVRWHRAAFRLHWKLVSRATGPVGQRPLSKEVRDLIFRMVAENPTWGAPRIHGELLMLGFEVSERTISRWMKRAPRNPEPAMRWLAFLHNHREVIAAMDFFTVPTITFGVLYCLFVIGYDRRRILHFNERFHSNLRRGFLSLTAIANMEQRFRLPSWGLGRERRNNRSRAAASGPILVTERLGGLHHRYDRVA